MEEIPVKTLVSGLGFLAGVVFGATAQKTHFCTMGGISDMVVMGDTRRFRSWMLAVAVALMASQTLWGLGYVDLGSTVYRTPNLGWLGAIVGGLLFGFGMVLGAGCGNKTLVRVGGGNLKSVVVFLVIGVVSYMTMRGLFAIGRLEIERVVNINLGFSQGLDAMLSAATGLSDATLRWVLAFLIGGALAAWCFKEEEFRTSAKDVAAGIIIGFLVPIGWFITGNLGNDDFDPQPVVSFTFIGPIGDTLQYLMTYTGSSINFAVASVFGVIVGSFLTAVATRTFRIEAFSDKRDLVTSLTGATLMGIGGVTAMGCTIGQGITGVSTLAFSSFLALLSIIAGGYYGMKYMEEGTLAGAWRAVLARS